MSIALKHIKERRFLREEKVNLPSEELIISDPPHKKRPSQIDYTGRFDGEHTKISNNKKTTLKSGLKAKNTQTAKFWEMVFNDAPTLKECELINILLKLANLEVNPSNNTKMLNKIFKDEYDGYIKQTSPYSHIWELKRR